MMHTSQDTIMGNCNLSDLVTDFEYVINPKDTQQSPPYAKGACFVSTSCNGQGFPISSFKAYKGSHFGLSLSAKIKPEILEKIAYRLYEGLGSISFHHWGVSGLVGVMVNDRIGIAHVRLGFVPLSDLKNLEIKEP